MRRGSIVVVALPREQGKPRPALVVQSDDLEGSTSVLVCPLTSALEYRAPHRPEVAPSPQNGLHEVCLVMTDKVQAAARHRCGQVVGHVGRSDMAMVEAALAYALGLRLQS